MIEAEVSQLERGPPKRDRSVVIDSLVGNHRVRVLETLETRLGLFVRDERGTGILERLAASDVVEVVVAIDHVPDRLVRDLLDLFYIGFTACGRP